MLFSDITNGSSDDAKLSTSTTRANIDSSHQHHSQEALTRQDFKSALMLIQIYGYCIVVRMP